ncbi:hypothetical protein MMC22_002290 [Lobaria immixta]|nr:hypothetical protein [Lobaria immixta]
MEFHTELDLIFVNGTAFDSFSGKITKAVAYDSSRFTSNIHIPGDKNWVTKSSERVLWLPPEYRARTYASHGNTIVFGLSNGHVSFLSLEDELGH